MDQIIKGVAEAMRQNNLEVERKLATVKRQVRNELTVALAKDMSGELIKDFNPRKTYGPGDLVRCRGGVFQAWTDTESHPLERESGWVCLQNGVHECHMQVDNSRDRTLVIELADGTSYEHSWQEPTPMHQGAWQEEKMYYAGDIVFKDGNSYIASKESMGKEPKDSDAWEILVQRGKPGRQGIQGDRGEQGEKGAKGDDGLDADPMVTAKVVLAEMHKAVKELLGDE